MPEFQVSFRRLLVIELTQMTWPVAFKVSQCAPVRVSEPSGRLVCVAQLSGNASDIVWTHWGRLVDSVREKALQESYVDVC
jgi:hypothetical protein